MKINGISQEKIQKQQKLKYNSNFSSVNMQSADSVSFGAKKDKEQKVPFARKLSTRIGIALVSLSTIIGAQGCSTQKQDFERKFCRLL